METKRPRDCPCHSGLRYAACCAPFHKGTQEAPTPETLMRSRYAAFALGLGEYLVRTLASNHPDRALPPRELARDLSRARQRQRFTGLRIVRAASSGDSGQVLFLARIFERGVDRSFGELSSFVREAGGWRYASGEPVPWRSCCRGAPGILGAARMVPPRYFVASGPGSGAAPFPGVVVEPLGCFIFPWAGGAEWVVGLGAAGELTAQPSEPRAALRPAVQAQLAFHETAGRRSRPLPVESLCLFEAQMVEHAPDLPGFNDPLLVHGTLLGPFAHDTALVVRTPGQLTVTRANVLHGLVAGATFAFQHADRMTGKSARTFHLVLPGDRQERLREGHGAVLAFPLLGADPALSGAGNEVVVDEMLYDVLAAVWRDVAREAPPPAREADELPVPSRAAHESRLTAQGFSIDGESAVRRQGRGWRALFASERRRLPPQGDTDVFLALANEALQLLTMTPWRLDGLGVDRRPPPAQPPPTQPPPAQPPPGAASTDTWWTTAAGREDWMRRYIEAQERRRDRG